MVIQRNGVPQVQKLPHPSYEFWIRDKATAERPPSVPVSQTGWEGLDSTPPPNLSSESQSGTPCKNRHRAKQNQNMEDSHVHGFRIDPRKQKGI